ncbi:hypothetical protein [Stenotrophomonas sp.]|uniref:hypothetical protein n=1 Tax=Stenotrophomonas sp. TaxID=69392 RepID=UPI00289A3096|nr:hypothetical protein [Stenotrophomonas sp.]
MSGVSVQATAPGINARQVFQWLSYLQYPALLVAFGYAARPLFNGMDGMLDAYNSALLYAGVGVGMSSLQDTRKTQNTMSRKVWEDPRKGGVMLWVLAIQALLPIVLGLLGAALASSTALAQLALGLVAFGLGMIGLLKTAIEMREHHRLDKKSLRSTATALEAGA